MEEVIVNDKQAYLSENYPFADIPTLTDQKLCIHCDRIITVGSYKVFRYSNGVELIFCPNAPECNGTVIDWVDLDEENGDLF